MFQIYMPSGGDLLHRGFGSAFFSLQCSSRYNALLVTTLQRCNDFGSVFFSLQRSSVVTVVLVLALRQRMD